MQDAPGPDVCYLGKAVAGKVGAEPDVEPIPPLRSWLGSEHTVAEGPWWTTRFTEPSPPRGPWARNGPTRGRPGQPQTSRGFRKFVPLCRQGLPCVGPAVRVRQVFVVIR